MYGRPNSHRPANYKLKHVSKRFGRKISIGGVSMDSENSDIQKNSFDIDVREDKKHRRSFSNLRNPAKAR